VRPLPAVDVPVDGYAAYGRHVNPTLAGFLRMTGRDLRLVRAKGSTVEDEGGRCYDDWIAGFGSLNLGHNPEAIHHAIRDHLATDAPNLYVESLNPFAGRLAARLTDAAGPGFEACFFCNSGAEAVEAALKTSLLATGGKRIVYAAGGYHGTTLGALSCMAAGPYRDGLADVLADFAEVPFGDLPALERELGAGGVAGFLLEPIQVEAGVRIAPDAYLREACEACHRAGALLLLDEVQTGMGRTGRLFAFQHAACPPDILVLAKSLGGGMVPMGATVMAHGIWERAYGGYLRCEIHNSTFGGNALACRVALQALERLSDPAFLAGVTRTATTLFSGLTEALAGSPMVQALRWRGLLGGIQLREVRHPWLRWENMGLPELAGRPSSGALLVERLARRGILAQVCGHDWSVVRVEPPLVVEAEACERFVEGVRDGVRWLEENA
jgi:acetylornithine/succinyldiaminopimelate/putrescine aminotransferase